MRRFFGILLMAVGGLIGALPGLCTMIYLASGDFRLIAPMLAPLGVSAALIGVGYWLQRSGGREP